MFRALILAATIAASTRGADAANAPVGSAPWGATVVETFATQPRAPWQADDPADSLYRAAREQLNRGDYRTAARSFGSLPISAWCTASSRFRKPKWSKPVSGSV